MFTNHTLSLFVAGSILAAALQGCGGDRGPQRVAVAGTVTFRGQPVEKGQIRFVPCPGTEAPVSAAAIVDGKYEVAGSGVPLGTHRIVVTARRVPQGSARQGPTDRGAPGEQFIPTKYNVNSKLTITIPPGSDGIRKDLALVD
jgi:hypothetical protein